MKLKYILLIIQLLVLIGLSKYIEISDNDYQEVLTNHIRQLGKPKSKSLLLFFTKRECQSCFEHLKDMRELGQISGKSGDVSIIDCDFERLICTLFQIDQFPLTYFLAADSKVYKYTGELGLKDLYEFINKAQQGEVSDTITLIDESTASFLSEISGFFGSAKSILLNLSQYFENQSDQLVNYMGYYYWSRVSKLIVYSIVIIGPLMIALFFLLYTLDLVCFCFCKRRYEHEEHHHDEDCHHNHSDLKKKQD
ncbi:UNKNOWN [Stylonychia lemnae]|uniref:Thioredoxin domain-containing protein n=1 Tax=Stylonychia lemnae TaxID=5949 RepID=A0A078AP89_STYLE|nr:UNKNOWN [Stylonychia lemnae]|eukprot:CDW84190.1 UNKNOWN [Stylonychia lemnae]